MLSRQLEGIIENWIGRIFRQVKAGIRGKLCQIP